MRCFAYGSNLDAQDWARHCASVGAAPEGLRPVGAAVLPDMALIFDYYAASRGGGVANVAPCVGHLVHGALFEADAATWRVLDDKEGAPTRYARAHRIAILADGRRESVVVYEVLASRRGGFVPPSAAYLAAVRRGYARFGLPPQPLERAATGAAPQADVSAVFCRSPAECELMRRVAGTSEALPAVDAAGLQGILHRCAEISAGLPMLDAAVGLGEPSQRARTSRVRTLVRVTLPDGRTDRAWCHVAGETAAS